MVLPQRHIFGFRDSRQRVVSRFGNAGVSPKSGNSSHSLPPHAAVGLFNVLPAGRPDEIIKIEFVCRADRFRPCRSMFGGHAICSGTEKPLASSQAKSRRAAPRVFRRCLCKGV